MRTKQSVDETLFQYLSLLGWEHIMTGDYDPNTFELVSSTDTIGIKSSYAYTQGPNGYVVSSLTTPYGTTTFSMGQTSSLDSYINVVDPLGGQERCETNLDASSVPTNGGVPPGVDDTYLAYRNNFYWSKKAMATAPPTISTAVITQFRHEPGFTTMSDVISSVQAPLENRVYYNYAGDNQTNPPYIVTGASDFPTAVKKLDVNSNLQEKDYTYNAVGNVLTAKDELGRVTTNVYAANNNDLIEVMQGTDVVAQYTYYPNHQVKVATDASGQQTSYTYDPTTFQLKTVTNAKGEVTTYNYTNGLLTSIVGNQGETEETYTYDGYNRVETATDVNGYTLTYDYDNLNRLTQVTYPDGTTSQNVYTILDVTQTKDRQNRWSTFIYNANRLLNTAIDPDNRYTSYQRCICGELTGLTDPNGNQTKWSYDIEGRLVSKTYADSTTESYVYEPSSSRLASFTDAKGQVTSTLYNRDDSVQSVNYTNCTISTPSVSYLYDPVYLRITAMTDGTGTTNYTYNAPAAVGSTTLGGDRLASETGPLGTTATINYSYDALGRVTGTSVNGTGSSVGYDSLDRVNTATNPLGTFTYSYVGMTPRVKSVSSTSGPTTNYSYLTVNQDVRLGEIQNLTHAGVALSKFDYTYNEVGTIASWQQQSDSSTPTVWNYQYDGADQLLSAIKTNTSTSAVLATYVYQYDLAGNRLSEQINLGLQSTSSNNLNQVTGHSGVGTMEFAGTLSKPATVTVGGNPAAVDSSNHFTGFAPVTNGVNNIPITAKDFSGNVTTNTIQVTEPSGTVGGTPTYDILGNMTNNGAGQTYEWDAKNEITAINYSGAAIENNITRSEFSYDGLRRRVKIIEKNASGTILSVKQHVWIIDTIAEERDASDTVQKRFYAQGVQIGTTSYFYTSDHLGSVRELVDISGTIHARYDYDPYGRVTLIQGVNLADFQYAGYYEHQTSGLNLTQYRAYDPNTGKWINRDPIAENGGVNLYAYCGNDPIAENDPVGLNPKTVNTAPLPSSAPPSPSQPAPTPSPAPVSNSGPGYTQTGPLGLDDDDRNQSNPNDLDHRNELPAGSPGYSSTVPEAVAPGEALARGVKPNDPAILNANGHIVRCVVYDTAKGPNHTNAPEVNSAAAKAAGLQIQPGDPTKGGAYPTVPGTGGAPVPATITFPTAH
jgi:RHS repeat-associated protein